ncbi:hypothetical protein Q3G72_000100 [Acer saccharum]|nr:hypothetical protein Q3G72_000100 [Acer saccharum]
MVEALAILVGMRLALELGLGVAVVESDALSVINILAAKSIPASDIGIIIHDILSLQNFSFASFCFVL